MYGIDFIVVFPIFKFRTALNISELRKYPRVVNVSENVDFTLAAAATYAGYGWTKPSTYNVYGVPDGI